MTVQKFNNTQSSTEHPKFTMKIYFYVKVFILKFVTKISDKTCIKYNKSQVFNSIFLNRTQFLTSK